MKVGVVIIGCGLIGNKRARALPDNATVVAAYDPSVPRARALLDEAGCPFEPTADIDAALRAPGAELAVVATPHDQLAGAALRALEAGCHVLLEKPGAMRHAQLAEVAAKADALGRVVRVGYNHRFHPAATRIREILATGHHGAPMYMRARYGHGGRLGYEQEWRATRAVSGGGEMIDQGSHLVDLFRHFVGDCQLEYSHLCTSFWPMDVEDNAFFALRAATGATGWLHASWTEWKNLFSLEVMAERAKLEWTGLGGSYGQERLTLYEMSASLGPPMETTWAWPPTDSSWQLETSDVVAAIEGRPAVGASVTDALAVLALVEEASTR